MDFSDDRTAADDFRRLLGELFGEVREMDRNGLEKVKDALPLISKSYKNDLRYACHDMRTDWSQPANQCAYVYLYFAHHCYIVYCSMKHPALKALCREGTGRKLKVCSIGGGPGSDLAGLTKFLKNTYRFAQFDSLVLDKYREWKKTWRFISHHLPYLDGDVTYSRCNLVEDRHLSAADRAFVRQADLLTLIKSFSAVSAFYRSDPQTGVLLLTILRDLKAGALVLYVDNQSGGDRQFEQEFALPAGLTLLAEFSGPVEMPIGLMPHNIQRYINILEYNPMRKCDLLVQLFKKPSPVTPESAYGAYVYRYTSAPLTTEPVIRTRRSINTRTEVGNDWFGQSTIFQPYQPRQSVNTRTEVGNDRFGQSTNFQPYQPRQSASKPSKDRCECTIL